MKKNILYKLIIISVLVITLTLEIIPYGAVLNFSTDGGTIIRETYSYFSLTPFGYANFGPLLTGIITVLLIILTAIFLFKENTIIFKVIMYLSILTFLFSLLPLQYGLSGFSVIGLFISLFLLTELILLFVLKKEMIISSML